MENKTFLWQTNHCQQASTQRNIISFSVRRNMIPERNMNVQVGVKYTRNSKYVGKLIKINCTRILVVSYGL